MKKMATKDIKAYVVKKILFFLSLFFESEDHFPLSAAGIRDVNKAKETKDAEEQYKAWIFCTTYQYLPWEKQPIVKLRD